VALPDFLLLGAPKTGTTALHVALARHPELFLSTNKEPKFFLADGRPPSGGGPGDAKTYREYVWRQADYEALFAEAPEGALKGESTTLYLRDSAAHRRIKALIPDAKLIAVLRDPVDRAHSNWTHLRSAGLEHEGDFLTACGLEDERAAKGWGPFWRYLGLGLYGEQLEHLYSLFPQDQVLLLLYRDLRNHPAEVLDRICSFLGVATGLLTELPAENVTVQASNSRVNQSLSRGVRAIERVASKLPGSAGHRLIAPAERFLQREQQVRPPLRVEDRASLVAHFERDIRLAESLTDLDLARWRDLRNGSDRQPLAVRGRFGTGFSSIDRPAMD
jgi:hypothetical protein